MEPLVIRYRPSFILLRLAGSLAFVVVGVLIIGWELPQAEAGSIAALLHVLAGLLSVVFFGGCALGVAWLACGPALRVDDTGIDNRTTMVCVRHVPWEQVAGLQPVWGGMSAVQVDFADPQWPWSRVRGLRALAARANAGMGFGPGAVATDPLGMTAEELLELLTQQLRLRRPDLWPADPR